MAKLLSELEAKFVISYDFIRILCDICIPMHVYISVHKNFNIFDKTYVTIL